MNSSRKRPARSWRDRFRLVVAAAGSALILDIPASFAPASEYAKRCGRVKGVREVVPTRGHAVKLARAYDRMAPHSTTHWFNKAIVRREGTLWRVLFTFPIDNMMFDGGTQMLICASNGALVYKGT